MTTLPVPAADSPARVPATTADTAMSERTRARVADGVAPNTQRAYRSALTTFTAWCAEQLQPRTALPATGETIAEYVTHLIDAGRAPSTIEQHLAAIATAHRAVELPAPAMSGARLALRSYRRERAGAGRSARKATPVTLEALRAMLDATGRDLRGLRDRLVLVLGVVMMARRSELAALTFDDVVETAEGLEVTVRTSKTDKDSTGRVVAVPRGQHLDTDPVSVLRAYVNRLAEYGVTSGPLLRGVDRHGHPRRGRLSPDLVGDVVSAAAERAGLQRAETYSGHSLRAGGATMSYRAGAPVASIAEHGRWSVGSPVMLGYLRSVDRWRENPMRGTGL